mmetsp:Transcript_44714/g.117246  ORF Transcript_44714/g.117246 Transcript_44714/m.117246 type:complete len:246 (+) Transcript_44714:318-1055(+)
MPESLRLLRHGNLLRKQRRYPFSNPTFKAYSPHPVVSTCHTASHMLPLTSGSGRLRCTFSTPNPTPLFKVAVDFSLSTMVLHQLVKIAEESAQWILSAAAARLPYIEQKVAHHVPHEGCVVLWVFGTTRRMICILVHGLVQRAGLCEQSRGLRERMLTTLRRVWCEKLALTHLRDELKVPISPLVVHVDDWAASRVHARGLLHLLPHSLLPLLQLFELLDLGGVRLVHSPPLRLQSLELLFTDRL